MLVRVGLVAGLVRREEILGCFTVMGVVFLRGEIFGTFTLRGVVSE